MLEKLSNPARRALEEAKITTAVHLSSYSEKDILSLHGIGKSSLPLLQAFLAESGLSFKPKTDTKAAFLTIDSYISLQEKALQPLLQEMRSIIKKTAPQATECINYGMPTFKLKGKNLVHFAAAKKHIGLYPGSKAISAFEAHLSAFNYSKGAIQFPLNQDLPEELIKTVVLYRLQEMGSK